MHESISSSLLRNRRSSSVISEQASKRSSISTCNLNIQSYMNNNSNMLNNNGGKIISNGNSKQMIFNNHNNINEKQQVTQTLLNNKQYQSLSSCINLNSIEQSLVKIKKVTIQVYRQVKKHVKQNILSFNEQQLKQVYQGLSNSLKSIEKLANAVSASGGQLEKVMMNINNVNNINSINNSGGSNSRQRYFQYTGSNINVNSSISMLSNFQNQHRKSLGLGESVIQTLTTTQQQHTINNNIMQQQHYHQLIRKLQLELQTIKTNHSEEIKQMIQTHQQQIGQVEKEHQRQLQHIQFNNERIKMESEKAKLEKQKQFKQIINQYEEKINEYEEKITLIEQTIRKQQQQQINILTKEKQSNEQKYKSIVRQLIQRLNKTKAMYDKIDGEYKERMVRFMDNIKRSVVSLIKSSNVNTRGLLQVIFERLTVIERSYSNDYDNNNNHMVQNHTVSNSNSNNSNNNPPLKTTGNKHLQKSTEIIQQMFQHNPHNNSNNDSQIMMSENIQSVIEKLVCELVMCGFFCEENEDNVMALFNISKQNRMLYDGVGGSNGINGEINNNTSSNMNIINKNNNMESNNGQIGIIGHGLFPLVMQKIKLTISSKYEDMIQQQNNINNNPQYINRNNNNSNNNVSEFTTSHYNNSRGSHNQINNNNYHQQNQSHLQLQLHQQPQAQQVFYRNIQSLEELQVSDSMICDHQQQFTQHQNHNYIYPNKQEEQTDELFRNNNSSSIRSNNDESHQDSNYHQDDQINNQRRQQLCYGGYESEDSGSFDIQIF